MEDVRVVGLDEHIILPGHAEHALNLIGQVGAEGHGQGAVGQSALMITGADGVADKLQVALAVVLHQRHLVDEVVP